MRNETLWVVFWKNSRQEVPRRRSVNLKSFGSQQWCERCWSSPVGWTVEATECSSVKGLPQSMLDFIHFQSLPFFALSANFSWPSKHAKPWVVSKSRKNLEVAHPVSWTTTRDVVMNGNRWMARWQVSTFMTPCSLSSCHHFSQFWDHLRLGWGSDDILCVCICTCGSNTWMCHVCIGRKTPYVLNDLTLSPWISRNIEPRWRRVLHSKAEAIGGGGVYNGFSIIEVKLPSTMKLPIIEGVEHTMVTMGYFFHQEKTPEHHGKVAL